MANLQNLYSETVTTGGTSDERTIGIKMTVLFNAQYVIRRYNQLMSVSNMIQIHTFDIFGGDLVCQFV